MQSCEWLIIFHKDQKVKLDFVAFELEHESVCQYDWLEVRNGNNSKSPLIGTKFCGNKTPAPITSTGNEVYVKFSSDGSVTKLGFKIEVTRSNLTGM